MNIKNLKTARFSLLDLQDQINTTIATIEEDIKKAEEEDEKTILIAGMKFAKCNLGTDLDTPCGKYYTLENALSHMPKGWSIPTEEQWIKFHKNTTFEYGEQDGFYGVQYTDIHNGNSIFLPAMGFLDFSTDLIVYDSTGYYMSTSIINEVFISILYFKEDYNNGCLSTHQKYGLSVRCIKND